MFWIDWGFEAIFSSNYDGTNITKIVEGSDYLQYVRGLVVYKDWLYWIDKRHYLIVRVDKHTGSNFEVVQSNLQNPRGLHIYSDELQPEG